MIFQCVFVYPPPPNTHTLSVSAACMHVCKIRFHMFVHMCECGHNYVCLCVFTYCNLSIYLQYINKGNFKKRLWRWSSSGSERPKPKDRILGYYNQTLRSAVLTYGNLTVTYNLIDPRDSNRTIGGTLLEVTCLDPDFRARSYPGSVCGETLLSVGLRPRHEVDGPVWE